MDRRSLTFVFLMTLSFLAFNHYFLDVKTPVSQEMQIEALKQKVVDTEALPLVSLHYSADATSKSIKAISLGNSLLTLDKEKKLPKTLYQGDKAFSLVKRGDGLAQYAADREAKVLSSYLGSQERDLQMVCLSDNSSTLALSSDEGVAFPLTPCASTAVAITDTADGWAFAGLWVHDTKSFTNLNELEEMESALTLTRDSTPMPRSGESFYVLENTYAQFVFSNIGGALAEINLKLHSKEDPTLVVNPISTDAEIMEQAKSNAYFPNFSYQLVDGSGSRLRKEPTLGGYTPLIRRSLLNSSGQVSKAVSPMYYALQLDSESANSQPSFFRVTSFTKSSITFEGKVGSEKVTRTYSLNEDVPYTLQMTMQVPSAADGIWMLSGIPEVELISGAAASKLQYYSMNGKKGSLTNIKLPKKLKNIDTARPVWTSNQNGFFALILDPTTATADGIEVEKVSGDDVPSRLTLIDRDHNTYPADKFPGYFYAIPYKATPKPLSFNFYAGPLEKDVLEEVDAALVNATTGASPNFAKAITIQGWFAFISAPFAKLLYLLLKAFYLITHSWGLSIILLTIALRIMLYPLNAWSFKSMAKMQALGPKQKKIQEKYKDDPKRMNMELAMLYKNEQVNPASGCLPFLVQIPFLMGMFDLLKSVFALRGASFIPGWINNLTAPDVLFSWSYPIPFFGTSFHLLPFLMAIMMYVQGKISQSKQASSSTPMTDQQKQMQSMGSIMAVVFFFLFYNMPSGLNIYFISSTVLGILQQWYTTKNLSANKGKSSRA